MANFRMIGTNHTGLTVSDIDRSISFFRDVLGFQVTTKTSRDPDSIRRITGVAGAEVTIVYVEALGHRIELIEYLAPEGRGHVNPRPCDVGHAHLAFDVDDIHSAISSAEAHHVKAIGPPCTVTAGPNKGAVVVYMLDPDGLTIEFIQPFSAE